MIKKKYLILILLASLSLSLLIGCRANKDFIDKSDPIIEKQAEIDDSEGSKSTKNKSENITAISPESNSEGSKSAESISKGIPTISPENNDEVLKAREKNEKLDSTNNAKSRLEIFGVWRLEKIALKSDAYNGTSKDALGDIDEEDYIGLELEFTDKYLRLGEEKFLNPEYTLEYMKVSEYNDGGKFRLPDVYDFIHNENIDIVNSEKYKSLSEVPLKFYQASFKEDYSIPVGTQVVVLNNDTMLVGVWGKIILAHRVKM